VRIRGYFSKPKGVLEQKSWGNTALTERTVVEVLFYTRLLNVVRTVKSTRSASRHSSSYSYSPSSFPLGPVSLWPGCTSALGLLCNPKYSNQCRFSNPVPLSEAVLTSFGSTSGFPKTLQRRRANASQQQIICCTVSISFLQNLQVGSPSNRPIVYRCPLTGACPVRITASRHTHSSNTCVGLKVTYYVNGTKGFPVP